MASTFFIRTAALPKPLMAYFSLLGRHPLTSSPLSFAIPFPVRRVSTQRRHSCRPCVSVANECRFRRRFSVKATQLSGPGSIDSPMMKTMEDKIKEQLSPDQVTVRDAYGDGRHVSIDVISSAFEGQSAVNRQRMVYKAIWEELQTTVHAVDQMTTRTPEEAASSG